MNENLYKVKKDLSELQLRAKSLASLGFAISDAMENSPNDVETYVPGVWLFTCLLDDFKNRLCVLEIPKVADHTSGAFDSAPTYQATKSKTAPTATTVKAAHE